MDMYLLLNDIYLCGILIKLKEPNKTNLFANNPITVNLLLNRLIIP